MDQAQEANQKVNLQDLITTLQDQNDALRYENREDNRIVNEMQDTIDALRRENREVY